jgi:protoporphyrinogen oxidase
VSRWAVIGGGVLGLSLAHRLAARGDQVTLIEAAPVLGGLAAAWELEVEGADGAVAERVLWDKHYHVTLLSDARTRAMLDIVGLEKQMRWVETRTGFYAGDGSLRSVSNSVEFLRLPTLNLLDKFRLALTILYGSKIRDGARMERIGVEPWLRRWSGRRTFERFWLPLLRAKLGDGYRQASAAFIWATIQRLYAARRTGLKKEMFGYPPGGYANVFTRFGEVLTDMGVKVELDRPVKAVRRAEGGGLVVEGVDGTTDHFDQVVVTAAAPIAADLCVDLRSDEKDKLRAVPYMGIVCASLLLKRPLADYYLTYITDPATPFTAVVEMTAFVDPVEVGGHRLVYLPKYLPPDDPLLDATDDEVRARFWPYLAKMYPALREADVLAFEVSRVRRVFAVPTLGASARVPATSTSVPGLHLIGSAQLPLATLNVNDTLSLVEALPR